MFLVHCLFVVAIAYACGAVVAGVVLRRARERALPAAARALLGLLLMTMFFSAAWQFLSLGQTWLLGLALLGMHAAGQGLREVVARLRAEAPAHARGASAMMAGALLFFAPLLVAWEFGPFTESGGDITIYSDASKLMSDQGLTAFGQRPSLQNVAPTFAAMLQFTTADRYARYADLRDELLVEFRPRINPPSAEVGANRLVANLFFSSVYYAPYAQFDIVSGATNYPAFFGVEAFFYAGVLACLWSFFIRFGRFPAWVAVALAVGSHSLVSVYYNAYSMQAISLGVCAVTLLMCDRIPLFSLEGLRCHGPGTLIVWLCYTHYMSVLAPLLALAVLAGWRWFTGAPPVEEPPRPRAGLGTHLAAAAALVLAAVLFVGGSAKAIDFVSGLVLNLVTGTKSEYLGDSIAPLSFRYLWFLFGLVSQQHLQPFAFELRWVNLVDCAAVLAAVAAAALGLLAMMRWAWRAPPQPVVARPFAAVLYLALAGTVAVHMLLANSSLYTQAKGAQNVLVVLYAALALPLALCWRDPRFARSALRFLLAGALVTFATAAMVPRAIYGAKLALGMDRGGILDRSYFDAAARIRDADHDAFVLFEPRKSADLYLGIQPFNGMRMMSTRHLVHDRLVFHGKTITKARMSVAETIAPGDVPHLWWLAYDRTRRRWDAARVSDARQPRLAAFADDYELGFGPRPLGAGGGAGVFSYVRNGDVMLVVPASRAMVAEVRLEPRDAAQRDKLFDALARDPTLPAAVADGPVAVLRREIAAAPQPRVVRLAGWYGEYWAHVRVDGVELK